MCGICLADELQPVNSLSPVYRNFGGHCFMSGVIFPKIRLIIWYSACLGVVRLTSRVYNNSFEESFDNAWTVMQDILEKTGCDTEEAILKLVDNKKNLYPLHKLNEKLNTEFEPVLSLYSEQDVRNMCVNLIRKSTKEKLILISVDNIEHMGTETWLFLQELLFSKIAIIIATVTEEYRPSIHFVKYIIQQVYKSINMRPLDEEELGLLACTVLNVQAINKAFLPFFFRYSGGNALRMEEILMILPLQKHFCLLPASGIPKRRLQTEFLSHPDLKKDPSVSLVCDILDLDELETLQIPSHLLDVVRDHTTGLSPEEQMLIRKCALLGDNFGIYVLEAVCPEYPTIERLRNGRPRVHDLCCSINICDFYAIHSEGKGVGSGCSVIGFLLRCPGKKELLFLLVYNDMVYDCLFERLVPELEFPSSLTAKERFG
ncbi:uncharacterized protein TNCV_3352901 [Trichonephila clavipes]|nr:uncharacterized protein TNCV_3352901 [Trichonephila clavipes]